MKPTLLCLIVCLISEIVFGQVKHAYTLFNSKGERIEFQNIIDRTRDVDVVLFGEQHDNPIAHWLEFELVSELFKTRSGAITIGAEMFETDNQLIVDEYLNGLITQQRFEAEARLWPNYKTDYKPLVEFAKSNNLRFVATNAPRRYASVVSAAGLEALNNLSVEAKAYLAPLPIEFDLTLPGYKAMVAMTGMPGKGHSKPEFLPMAQALKDATMANSIAKNLKKGYTFVHFHGTYHSNNYEGIYWYLKRYKPNITIITIATVTQDEVESLNNENLGIADFILVVPERMTRTY